MNLRHLAGLLSFVGVLAAGEHRNFQPVTQPTVPEVRNTDRVANPIDSFLLARLERAGLALSPPADKRTLVRRVYFDLIGLPPTPRQVNAFLKDSSPKAFAAVVDGLLESPHYGERWGRHWLDVARYSDTKGPLRKTKDQTNPYAWTYRDYVIRAFNNDKPFDQFIIEQIAADRIELTDRRDLAALGFLTLGDQFRNRRHDIIDDQIDAVTKGFMGLTVSCARCHDHKFDPIPTADYYSLHGIFASSVVPKEAPLIVPVDPNSKDTREFEKLVAPLKQQVAEASVVVDVPGARRKSKKAGNRSEMKSMEMDRGRLLRQISALELTHPGAPIRAHVLNDAADPRDSPILLRGEPDIRDEVVPRRFLELFAGDKERARFTEGSGRLELARAIASRDNPLTARTLVNRLWQHHFGAGLVPSPNDLGMQAEPPSHPELLDWLAVQFMNNGWSIKHMHRLILLSHTWRQQSLLRGCPAAKDPANQLLWRQHVRRLEFEPLRDTILFLGGVLDPQVYGKPVNLSSFRRTVYGYVDRARLDEILGNFDFANPDFTVGRRDETTIPLQGLFLMNSPLVVEQARRMVALPEFTRLRQAEDRIGFLFERVYQRPAEALEISIGLRYLTAENTPTTAPKAADERAARKQKNRAAKRTAKRPGAGTGKTSNAVLTSLNDGLRSDSKSQRQSLTNWESFAHALFMSNEMYYIR